jgi:pimeloyl-ACP methyl ester carboxylesterase
MKVANVNGVELEYETTGSGEPVLLISPVVAGAFRPFMSAKSLKRYRLIRYHKRGWCGSTHTTPPVRIADHAADAAALLDELGVSRAHVAGHSSGGPIALQLALDYPDRVHTLTMLEPSFLSLPSAQGLFAKAGPAMEAYGTGDHETAVESFLSVVSGLERDTCRAVIEQNVPGGVAQAIKDADTFFGVELPAVIAWKFGADEAAAIHQPILSVRGTETEPLWIEVVEQLHSWFPQVEDLTVEGVGHLLQMQNPEPVALGVAAFLGRHAMSGEKTADSRRHERQRQPTVG